MTLRQQIAMLPDGKRLHLQDGPIDLIIGAVGAAADIERAYKAAIARFATILDELCDELVLLKAPARQGSAIPQGVVAKRMHAAVAPFAQSCFITPMAAVAGAVAEEMLAAMTAAASLERAYVNNGGDIALHIAAGTEFRIGMVDDPKRPTLFGNLHLSARDGIAGVATSGCGGRSFSLGIADAVTILARSAAEADAAATIIANAVDLPGHPRILRRSANSLQPDNDLGDRMVTRAVEPLPAPDIERALARGVERAEELCRDNLIRGAALRLQGETRLVEPFSSVQPTLNKIPTDGWSVFPCLTSKFASASSRSRKSSTKAARSPARHSSVVRSWR